MQQSGAIKLEIPTTVLELRGTPANAAPRSRGLDELLDSALDSLGGGFVALPGALLLALRLTLGLPLAAALLLLAAAASVLFAAQLLWALPLSAAVRLLLPRDPRAPPRPQRLRFEALRVVLVGGADATTVALGAECLRRGSRVSLVAPHGDALGAAEEELQDRAEEAETSEGRADGWAEEQVSSFAIDAPAGPKVRAILGAQFSAQFAAQFSRARTRHPRRRRASTASRTRSNRRRSLGSTSMPTTRRRWRRAAST